MNQFLENVRRRPHRVWEAVLLILGSGGIVLLPETEAAVNSVIALLVTLGIVGGEVAQTQTTSLADPRDKDGTPLTRSENG